MWGELYFENVRMIIHYVDGGYAKQEVQTFVNISNETSVYVLTSHLMGVQGVDLDARFADMLSNEESFLNLELFLTRTQIK